MVGLNFGEEQRRTAYGRGLQLLDSLAPGGRIKVQAKSSVVGLKKIVVDIVRPTGFSTATAELAV